MTPLVKDFHGVLYKNVPDTYPDLERDTASCEVPAEGFLTKDKTYEILGLRPEEGRVVVIDDRGLLMWARADRFRLWISGGMKGLLERETFCKDCGVQTQPGVGSARCGQCWEDRCG